MRNRRYLFLLLTVFSVLHLHAQSAIRTEVFCGAELYYSDVNYIRLYNSLINATPGVKVHLGNDWMVAGQLQVPVVNVGYPNRLNMVRLSMANISKELRFSEAKQYFKLSAGLFGLERYGADLRWAYPVNSWLMLHARAGLTSHYAFGADFEGNSESEFAGDDWSFQGIAGANVWLDQWATEFRASGGRYLNGDYGVEGEIARHFNHCTVSIYAQKHERYMNHRLAHNYSGGFRVVMMIPPYKKSDKKFVIRPASNFRLTYNAQADDYSMKRYNTDPEENERTQPIRIPWGTGNFNE